MLIKGPFFFLFVALRFPELQPFINILFFFPHCKPMKANFVCSINWMVWAIQSIEW